MKYFLMTIFSVFLLLGNFNHTQAAEEMNFTRVTDFGAENFVKELRYIPSDILVEFDDIQRTPQFDSTEDNTSAWLNLFRVKNQQGFFFYLVNADGYIVTIGVTANNMDKVNLNIAEKILLTCIGLNDLEINKLLNSPSDVISVYSEKIRRRIWIAADFDGSIAIIATER